MKASRIAALGSHSDSDSQQAPSIVLDWSGLLGFDQACVSARADGAQPRVRLARMGIRVGAKRSVKPTSRT